MRAFTTMRLMPTLAALLLSGVLGVLVPQVHVSAVSCICSEPDAGNVDLIFEGTLVVQTRTVLEVEVTRTHKGDHARTRRIRVKTLCNPSPRYGESYLFYGNEEEGITSVVGCGIWPPESVDKFGLNDGAVPVWVVFVAVVALGAGGVAGGLAIQQHRRKRP